MTIDDLKKLIKDIVFQANSLKNKFVNEITPVNYACIFCQGDTEYDSLLILTKQLGKIIDNTPSGPLFQITPLPTIAGDLQLLKIRKPDASRPERGDADFTLSNYQEFKDSHLTQEGFKLIDKESFEMIELIDPNFNLRVYFSNPPLDKQLGLI